MNGFKHGLSRLAHRRTDGVLSEQEQSIRDEILAGLIEDKGGESQMSTSMRVLAEIIASDVSLLISFNRSIEAVIKNNQKARENPRALAQLDSYKRPLVGSLSANLQRFGFDRITKVETVQSGQSDQVMCFGFGLGAIRFHYFNLTPLLTGRFYRFEHIDTYSSGKVVAK